VIALVAGQTEKAFLQEGVALVPQGEREADFLVAVANSGQAVFVPARGAAGAVVLAHGTPGALGQVRAPPIPVRAALAILFQAQVFRSVSRHGFQCNPRPQKAALHYDEGLPLTMKAVVRA
jgi:hypothetical protein